MKRRPSSRATTSLPKSRAGLQPRALRLGLHGLGDVAQPELLDEQRVEAGDGHVPAPDPHGRHAEPRAQRRERVVELAGFESLRAAEARRWEARAAPGLAHHPLRDGVPAAEPADRGLGRRGARQQRHERDQPMTRHARHPRWNRDTNTIRR